MTFRLSRRAGAAGYGLAAFETIGSTSVEAMARAAAGETGPLWVVSDAQSAGIGRRGATWQTPPGNLAASLLLTADLPPATVAQLGFVAGVALVRALEECCGQTDTSVVLTSAAGASRSTHHGRASFEMPAPRAPQDDAVRNAQTSTEAGDTRESLAPPHAEVPRSGLEARAPFRLKWPNDVLADGAKLAGILLQTEEVRGRRAVVTGIGVNVAHAPTGLPYRAASLREHGETVDTAGLFEALSGTWLDAALLWDEGRGFAAVREAWLARAAGLRAPITIRSGETLTRGTFETIDEHGHLVVRATDGSVRRVDAGEVHFGTAATAREEAAA